MRRRWLWVAAALAWTAAFDVQARWAASAVTDDHLRQWHAGQTPGHLADAMGARLQTAAYTASGLTVLVVLPGLAWGRRSETAIPPK